MAKIDKALTKHVARLANIPVKDEEAAKLSDAFRETFKVIDELKQLSVEDVEPSHQVTGLSNVMREDKVDEERMFSQKEALQNAPRAHNGFFVVPRILEKTQAPA